MDFVIGLIVGLFFGGWIGLAVASLIAISRDKDIEVELEAEEHENDPDGSKAVMEEAIEVLKKQRVVRIAQQSPTVSRFDDDTWKEDMERDAEQYKAGE